MATRPLEIFARVPSTEAVQTNGRVSGKSKWLDRVENFGLLRCSPVSNG